MASWRTRGSQAGIPGGDTWLLYPRICGCPRHKAPPGEALLCPGRFSLGASRRTDPRPSGLFRPLLHLPCGSFTCRCSRGATPHHPHHSQPLLSELQRPWGAGPPCLVPVGCKTVTWTSVPPKGSSISQLLGSDLLPGAHQQPGCLPCPSYPFFSWNGALPVHKVHRAVGIFCWDSHKTLRTIGTLLAPGRPTPALPEQPCDSPTCQPGPTQPSGQDSRSGQGDTGHCKQRRRSPYKRVVFSPRFPLLGESAESNPRHSQSPWKRGAGMPSEARLGHLRPHLAQRDHALSTQAPPQPHGCLGITPPQ